MSNLLEDYREISNVREKLDLVVDLVNSASRRVFLTQRGEVKAIVLSPRDYEELWKMELYRDMAVARDERERGMIYSHDEVVQMMEELIASGRESREG
jgi:PHD/YefM family antitoxin component YafN of YafNO toxin-antitoxin module